MGMANSVTLYHRTIKNSLSSILENGLLRSKATSLKVVYLSRDKNDWHGDVLLEVTLPRDEYPELCDLSDWEFVCWHDIKPQHIKVCTKSSEEELQTKN